MTKQFLIFKLWETTDKRTISTGYGIHPQHETMYLLFVVTIPQWRFCLNEISQILPWSNVTLVEKRKSRLVFWLENEKKKMVEGTRAESWLRRWYRHCKRYIHNIWLLPWSALSRWQLLDLSWKLPEALTQMGVRDTMHLRSTWTVWVDPISPHASSTSPYPSVLGVHVWVAGFQVLVEIAL